MRQLYQLSLRAGQSVAFLMLTNVCSCKRKCAPAVCRKQRQRRNVQLIVLEGVMQWLNLVFYVLPNAFLTANPCYLLSSYWFWFGLARWTCWNTVS